MIKINLLGVARPAARVAGPPPTATRQAVIMVASLLVAFGVVGGIYWLWSNEISRLEADLKKEKAEQARLAGIQAENQRYQRQIAQLTRRIDTVQMLQSSRVGPVELMTRLGETVNRTNDLYLLTMTPEGNRIAMRGQANSVKSIADFIAALKGTGTFEDVQLRQYYQDDQHNRLSFKFNLDCLYKRATAAAPAAQPTTTPAPPARRAGM